MNPRKKLNKTRNRRAIRATAKIFGTAERPRLTIDRSNRFISVQLIDDTKGVTIASATSVGAGKGTKSEHAFAVGETIAKKAKEKGVSQAVFDRRSYRFHGRVKQVAEGAKKEGLKI